MMTAAILIGSVGTDAATPSPTSSPRGQTSVPTQSPQRPRRTHAADTLPAIIVAASDVEEYTKQALPDKYGSVWIDQKMNRVHVLLKNPGSGDATQVSQHNRHPELLIHDRAQFSEKEIFALRDRVIADRAVLASLGVQIASAGEKASVNKVAISVVSTTAATTSAATAILNQRYGSNAITVGVVKELAKGTDREAAPPFLAGYELNLMDPTLTPRCTMGFIGYRNAGDFEIITAGHCFDTSTPVYHTVRGSGPQFIAYVNTRQFVDGGSYDVESITIPAGAATSQVIANNPQTYQVLGADT